MRGIALLLAAVLGAGCAATPRPRALGELDAVRASPSVTSAKTSAPQAWARAEGLRRRAEQAHEDEDTASSQILAERARAAYERAVTLSALVRTEARAASAEVSAAKLDTDLARTSEIQSKLDAETRALELRLKVARETIPVQPSGPPASPERELARREAAQALAAQARLLCTAARLLDPALPTLAAVIAKVNELEARLPTAPMAPLDEARTARTACLRELSNVRRPKTQAHPASPTADRLLSELGQASWRPSRDDRGVVVTLERPFERDDRLTRAAAGRLSELGAIAKGHPEFPLLVVVHGATRLPEPREAARAEQAAAALRQNGAPRVDAAGVGTSLPGVDRKQPGAAAKNERVEVVFVAPSAT